MRGNGKMSEEKRKDVWGEMGRCLWRKGEKWEMCEEKWGDVLGEKERCLRRKGKMSGEKRGERGNV